MAKAESRMLELGTTAPDFSLPDADGELHALSDTTDADAYLVMFICNHCPFVKHVRDQLAAIGRDYGARNVAIFAINSNDASTYPEDSPEKMKEEVAAQGYTFPYLVDEDQSVAKAYEAACTPDFYVFDRDRRLTYRGQLDDSRPSNDALVDGADLRAALAATIAGKPIAGSQTPSVGCNIKWKAGNAPTWFG
jgi:peroxiredoxin